MISCRGQPIPYLEYTPDEVHVWDVVLERLSKLYPTHACDEFLQTFPMFGFKAGEVPQLEDLSAILRCALHVMTSCLNSHVNCFFLHLLWTTMGVLAVNHTWNGGCQGEDLSGIIGCAPQAMTDLCLPQNELWWAWDKSRTSCDRLLHLV
jgi:hypothetical protein